MKRLLTPILFLVTLLGWVSCNDDEPSIPTYVGMGTLQKSADVYSIAFDGASTCLVPDSSLLVYKKLQQPGKRVIALYNYLSDRRDDKTIFLQDIVGVLTKPLAAKPASPQEDQALGTDVLRIERAWMGGGYINVKFYYLSDPVSDKPHYINAFDTGEVDKDGCRILEMRHNANGHQPIYVSPISYVSFADPVSGDNGRTRYKIRYQYDSLKMQTVEVDPS